MARFKYLGEPARPELVASYGPSTQINVRLKNGAIQELTPIPPATEFEVGVDIGYDITDQRALRFFRSDSRFEEIV